MWAAVALLALYLLRRYAAVIVPAFMVYSALHRPGSAVKAETPS